MDNIQTLLEKQQYDLVVKLTENPQNNNDIFSRITALLALSKGEDALATINKYQKQLEVDLPLLMKVHIELLCLLKRFDEAYEKASYYQNLPYHSQQAEELLKTLNEKIRTEERRSYISKDVSEDELKSRLLDKDENTVLFALDHLKEKDITPYLKELEIIIKSFPRQTIRCFALFTLVERKLDKEILFLHMDKLITVNPKELRPPFVDQSFQDFVKRIHNEFKDVSLSTNAVNILSSFIIYTYPDNVILDDNLLAALLYVSKSYLQIEMNLSDYCKKNKLEYSLVKHLSEYIALSLQDF